MIGGPVSMEFLIMSSPPRGTATGLCSHVDPDTKNACAYSRHGAGQRQAFSPADAHSRTVLNRIALPITLTDDSAMAAAAMIGDSRMPKNGYSTPAATGTPSAL